MAKKKAETKETFDAFLERQYGEGIVQSADDLVVVKRNIVRTVLSLDISLSGGIPDGSVCLFTGRPKAGKSTLCLEILRHAIDQGRPAYYMNVERRNLPRLMECIQGLDAKKLRVLQSTKDRILTAEDWLSILERTIKDNPGAVIAFDSLSSVVTEIEASEDLGSNKDMAGVPKLLAKFFRRIQQVVDTNNCVLMFISQVMSNRDPRSKRKWVEKGGNAIQYSCSVWVSATYESLWEPDKETGERMGKDVHWTVFSSALGKPYIPCRIPIWFGHGVDRVLDIINHAENLALVERKGAWYTIPSLSDDKWQGINNLIEFLREHPELATELENQIRGLVLSNGR